MAETSGSANLWVAYAFIAVVCWGLYGVAMHAGQMSMGDPENGRYKAFLFVGIAYVLVAVIGPLYMLISSGADWGMPLKGWALSLFAGALGAFGAFGVLLAFGAKGHPAVVMSIIFAGAPIVNATAAMLMHPPAGGFSSLRWQFIAGIALAAIGGMLVTLYKPGPGAPKPPSVEEGPH
jgi:drug/metabolite transporter (DMT)-like permease